MSARLGSTLRSRILAAWREEGDADSGSAYPLGTALLLLACIGAATLCGLLAALLLWALR